MKIHVDLNEESINKAIRKLEEYQKWLDKKADEISRKLAEIGATNISLEFSRAIYTGPKDISVNVENIGDGKYAIIASGETVLIAEFGAGVTYGYGHPENGKFGMGPGTHPDGVGHWNDPNGWWLPKSKGGEHTYGNPPAMAVYNTEQMLKKEIQKIAEEVLSSD